MTTAGPPEDVDAQFAAIVSGLQDVTWSHTPQQLDNSVAQGTSSRKSSVDRTVEPTPEASADRGDSRSQTQLERDRRREVRRAERSAEVAAFEAERQQNEEEQAADNDHFVPPEPPPLPRLRRRTVSALLLMALGVVALTRPRLLQLSPDGVMVFGLILLLSGLGLLVSGLRARAADPDAHDGWDDGARL